MPQSKSFIELLPPECQGITILPRHRVALAHRFIGNSVWIVLLTQMPGDQNKAWHLTKNDYFAINPKHEYRDRWIRENLEPTIKGKKNPIQMELF